MSAERHDRLQALFLAACELDESARGRFLADACGEDSELRAELDRGTLKAGESQKTYLRIVIGATRRPEARRAPMNVALVIDRSGSMASQGRIENARRAAQMAVDRLGRDDYLSVVSYDDRVEVEVPSTKVAEPYRIKDKIGRLTPRGSTAIHAGERYRSTGMSVGRDRSMPDALS